MDKEARRGWSDSKAIPRERVTGLDVKEGEREGEKEKNKPALNHCLFAEPVYLMEAKGALISAVGYRLIDT